MTDITERERVLALQNSAMQSLRDTDRLRSEFLSRMSHELRTPLNAVLGFARLLLVDGQHPTDATNVERASHIERAGQHLLALIEESLDLAAIEAGRMNLQRVPVPVAPLVQASLDFMQLQARSLGVRLQADLTHAPPAGVLADPLRLRQVLINLLANAIKYNRAGSEVSLRCGVDTATGVAEITVCDDGPGLSPEQLDRLFEPFERLGAKGHSIPGTGLGLTITHQLVLAMGGDIRVDSSVGRGTCFSVRLTTAPVPPAPGATPA